MSRNTPKPSAEQRWDPERYQRNAAFVAKLGRPVLDLLDPQPGERILDVGCGDGALTEVLTEAGCQVVGIDPSAEQVAAARARGLDARVAHAEEMDFEACFDAVFTNAAMHWVKAQRRALSAMFRALRPGGRLVGEMGGCGNMKLYKAAIGQTLERRGIDPAPLDPWYFPSEEKYTADLESCGFRVVSMKRFERPTMIETDPPGWYETFGESYLLAVPEDDRPRLLEEVTESLRPDFQKPDGSWFADYVRLRFKAVKPA